MEPKAATTFAEQLRRFVRWFFTVTPDAVVDPAPKPLRRGGNAKGRRQDARLRAQHAGRVHVSDRKSS